ncbi:hypothetical protein [Sinosporangium siamense]|uniref:Secreted protein n=1 Tax=Sinosporangium siamense TaxID=1367973 RepID=A0A919RHX7_9ACTN|nr:hypothetical protein [Sinosporangium siamense]GII93953.1 hypothetical protein Ssi02_41840 [Sinosporangium siamense]
MRLRSVSVAVIIAAAALAATATAATADSAPNGSAAVVSSSDSKLDNNHRHLSPQARNATQHLSPSARAKAAARAKAKHRRLCASKSSRKSPGCVTTRLRPVAKKGK